MPNAPDAAYFLTVKFPSKTYHKHVLNLPHMKKQLCYLLLGMLCTTASAQTQPEPAAATDYSDYGGKAGIGFSILDGIGVPARLYLGHHVLEAGAYMGGVALYDANNDLVDIGFEPLVGAGYTYFGNRYLKPKRKRDKIRSNGICLRVNQLLGTFPTTVPSLSWAQETFREGRKYRSFIFELGIQYSFPNFSYDGVEQVSRVGLRLRCHWNFFLK
jgi:hypothetical protein